MPLKKSNGECCPHCGNDDGYEVGIRVNGWVTYISGWDGDEEVGDDSTLHYSRPKAVRCQSCGKRVEYPKPSHQQGD